MRWRCVSRNEEGGNIPFEITEASTKQLSETTLLVRQCVYVNAANESGWLSPRPTLR